MQSDLLDALIRRITVVGDRAPGTEETIKLIEALEGLPGGMKSLVLHLLNENQKLHSGLDDASNLQEQLKAHLEKLTAPPWHCGVLVQLIACEDCLQALVSHGSTLRVVHIAEQVDLDSLAPGDEVFLSDELNVLINKAPQSILNCGETAFFERYSNDRRVVVKWRDEELILGAAAALGDVELRHGDQIRWDRSAWMAFEKIARAEGDEFLLGETPNVSCDQVGGQGQGRDQETRGIDGQGPTLLEPILRPAPGRGA